MPRGTCGRGHSVVPETMSFDLRRLHTLVTAATDISTAACWPVASHVNLKASTPAHEHPSLRETFLSCQLRLLSPCSFFAGSDATVLDSLVPNLNLKVRRIHPRLLPGAHESMLADASHDPAAREYVVYRAVKRTDYIRVHYGPFLFPSRYASPTSSLFAGFCVLASFFHNSY